MLITYVDKNDNVIGKGTREEAWIKGHIHRIIRVFVFNSKGELLVQKRSDNVSSPGKWDQSVGGHVNEGESYLEAALRETKEELGIGGVELTELQKFFTNKSNKDKHIKNRFNMLYTTTSDAEVNPDPYEVSEVKWVSLNELGTWMKEKPGDFTKGFIKSYAIYLREKQN